MSRLSPLPQKGPSPAEAALSAAGFQMEVKENILKVEHDSNNRYFLHHENHP